MAITLGQQKGTSGIVHRNLQRKSRGRAVLGTEQSIAIARFRLTHEDRYVCESLSKIRGQCRGSLRDPPSPPVPTRTDRRSGQRHCLTTRETHPSEALDVARTTGAWYVGGT